MANQAPEQFSSFLGQLKQSKLSREKLKLLESSSFILFTGEQLCQITLCFPHSSDKKDAVELLSTRLARVPSDTAADIIRAASFSRDRLGILQILVQHISDISDQNSQKVVVNAFDFFIDKDEAWEILSKAMQQVASTSCESPQAQTLQMHLEPGEDLELEALMAEDVHDAVNDVLRQCVQPTKKRMNVFELPIMSELRYFQAAMPELKENVVREVERRRAEGNNFMIPSRVYAISNRLRPDRRLTLPPAMPIVVHAQEQAAAPLLQIANEPHNDALQAPPLPVVQENAPPPPQPEAPPVPRAPTPPVVDVILAEIKTTGRNRLLDQIERGVEPNLVPATETPSSSNRGATEIYPPTGQQGSIDSINRVQKIKDETRAFKRDWKSSSTRDALKPRELDVDGLNELISASARLRGKAAMSRTPMGGSRSDLLFPKAVGSITTDPKRHSTVLDLDRSESAHAMSSLAKESPSSSSSEEQIRHDSYEEIIIQRPSEVVRQDPTPEVVPQLRLDERKPRPVHMERPAQRHGSGESPPHWNSARSPLQAMPKDEYAVTTIQRPATSDSETEEETHESYEEVVVIERRGRTPQREGRHGSARSKSTGAMGPRPRHVESIPDADPPMITYTPILRPRRFAPNQVPNRNSTASRYTLGRVKVW